MNKNVQRIIADNEKLRNFKMSNRKGCSELAQMSVTQQLKIMQMGI